MSTILEKTNDSVKIEHNGDIYIIILEKEEAIFLNRRLVNEYSLHREIEDLDGQEALYQHTNIYAKSMKEAIKKLTED